MQAELHHPPSGSLSRSALMALAGFFCWSTGDAAIRALNHLPLSVVSFGYSLAAVALLMIFSSRLGGIRETFRRPKLPLRMGRGLLLACSNFCAVVAFSNLDLATGYAIVFLSPFMVKLLSVVLLGERISPRSWLLSALGFAGVLIVLRPGQIPLNTGVLAALALIVFFSLGHILSPLIGEKNQTRLSMSLFQYLFLALAAAPFAFRDFAGAGIDGFSAALLLVCGATSIGGAIFVTTAFARAPARVIAPLHYSQMIWGVLFGMLLFGEYPDGFTLLGAGVIAGSGLLLMKFPRKETT